MAVRVNIVDGTTLTGVHGPNSSINVVLRTNPTTPLGVYHPCGAFNVVLVPDLTALYHASGAYNAVDLGGGFFSFGPSPGLNLAAGESLTNVIRLNIQPIKLNNQFITRA